MNKNFISPDGNALVISIPISSPLKRWSHATTWTWTQACASAANVPSPRRARSLFLKPIWSISLMLPWQRSRHPMPSRRLVLGGLSPRRLMGWLWRMRLKRSSQIRQGYVLIQLMKRVKKYVHVARRTMCDLNKKAYPVSWDRGWNSRWVLIGFIFKFI